MPRQSSRIQRPSERKWNEFEWDDKHGWWRSRQKANGEWEYDHRKPETPRFSNGVETDEMGESSDQTFDEYLDQDCLLGATSYTLGENPDGTSSTIRRLEMLELNEEPSGSTAIEQSDTYDDTQTFTRSMVSDHCNEEADTATPLRPVTRRLSTTAESHMKFSSATPQYAQRTESVGSVRRIQTQDPDADVDPLDPRYKKHTSSWFKHGRVFMILWSEPWGDSDPQGKRKQYTQVVSNKTRFGENIYSSIRRFIIVQEYKGHCLCVPILTYGGRATTKSGVHAQDHAIVYVKTPSSKSRASKRPSRRKGKSKSESKDDIPEEIEGEEKLHKKPIRMLPWSPEHQLDEKSRINYAKVYTVEHNVKVWFIGEVHSKSMKYFDRDYERTHIRSPPTDPATQYSDEEEPPDDFGRDDDFPEGSNPGGSIYAAQSYEQNDVEDDIDEIGAD